MWRFIAVQTAISIAINTGIGAAPAAVARLDAEALPASSVHDVVAALAPQIVMGGLMSALVPALLARRQGVIGRQADTRGSATVLDTVAVAFAVGISFAAVGLRRDRAAPDRADEKLFPDGS